MDLHRFEMLAGLLWLALGLALIPSMLMSRPRKPRRQLLVPALLIASAAIVLLDGYAWATQGQRVAIPDGTYNVTSANDHWLYLDTGGAINWGVHRSDLVYIKDSQGESPLPIDRIEEHPGPRELIVEGDWATLRLPQEKE